MRCVTVLHDPERCGYHTLVHDEGFGPDLTFQSMPRNNRNFAYRGYSPISTTLEDCLSVEGAILEYELGDSVEFIIYHKNKCQTH